MQEKACCSKPQQHTSRAMPVSLVELRHFSSKAHSCETLYNSGKTELQHSCTTLAIAAAWLPLCLKKAARQAQQCSRQLYIAAKASDTCHMQYTKAFSLSPRFSSAGPMKASSTCTCTCRRQLYTRTCKILNLFPAAAADLLAMHT